MHDSPFAPEPDRRMRRRALLAALLIAAALAGAVPRARSEASGAAPALAQLELRDSVTTPVPVHPARALNITRVEFTGLTRTGAARAERAAALTLPAPATSEAIAAASERLRASRLFASVDAHTRPGDEPGDVVLVFDVRENRPGIRFGLGYEDYSSWYLIPAQLHADNLTGHGESLSLGARVGYRVAGFDLTLRKPATRESRDFWETKLRAEHLDRIYFLDGVETTHGLDRGSADLRVGRALGRTGALESWLAFETTHVDSNASIYSDRPSQDREKGESVPFAELPATVRRDVRTRPQTRLGLALSLDRRHGTGLQARGVWARASGEAVASKFGTFGSWQLDLRGYAPLGPDVQLAARVRAATLSPGAPFYERYHVGGLYTVRGYPSQALSPPEGVLNLGAGSLELRTSWWGPASDPRFAGIAFVDAGVGWTHATPALRDAAAGAGFGFRARVPWLGRLGVDVARPLSRSPVKEAFHVNGSIGWAF